MKQSDLFLFAALAIGGFILYKEMNKQQAPPFVPAPQPPQQNTQSQIAALTQLLQSPTITSKLFLMLPSEIADLYTLFVTYAGQVQSIPIGSPLQVRLEAINTKYKLF